MARAMEQLSSQIGMYFDEVAPRSRVQMNSTSSRPIARSAKKNLGSDHEPYYLKFTKDKRR